MSESRWYQWPGAALRGLTAALGWWLFCRATHYPTDGHVCDFAPTKTLPLPCEEHTDEYWDRRHS